MNPLRNTIKLYVPGTTNVNQQNKAEQEKQVEKVMMNMAKWFGGATAMPAEGAYIAQDGSLVREPIIIVIAFGDDNAMSLHTSKVISLARQIAVEMNQESVSVEVDGGLIFISQSVAAAA